jgi:hypothetical protein
MFTPQSIAKCLVGFLTATATATLLAQNAHYLSGPTCTFDGSEVSCSGRIAGLGNGDVTFAFSGQATFQTTCVNKGGNEAPGQNPAIAQTSGSVTVDAGDIKNGSLTFDVVVAQVTEPTGVTAKEAGCPGANWNVVFSDPEITSGTLTISQGGQVVLSSTVDVE